MMLKNTLLRIRSTAVKSILSAGLMFVVSPALSALKIPEKPNVLFISIDDLRPELGSYGNTLVKTPSIDRIAAQGMQFNHAYAQQAVCVPSRTSVLTGWRPSNVGVIKFETHFRDPQPNIITLPQSFMAAGYQVRGLGKVFHHRDPQSWQERVWVPEPDFVYPMYLNEENKKKQAEIIASGKARPKDPVTWWGKGDYWVPANSWEAEDVPDEAYFDGKIANKAIEYLHDMKDKPFFLAVGFFRPHIPFIAPKKYFDLYDLDTMPLSANENPPEGVPDIALHNWGETRLYTDIPAKGDISITKQKELLRGYYASISYADAQVGKLLDELKKLDLYKNTIVVVWSDHGYHLGDLGLWGKYTNFEKATRTPLIIHVPWAENKTFSQDELVELLDIYPTVMDFAGLIPKQKLQGKSLKPLWDKSTTDATNNYLAYSEYTRAGYTGYSVRNKGYRYTYWRPEDNKMQPYYELYQYAPGEMEKVNLANNAKHSNIQRYLHQKIIENLPNKNPI